MVFCEFRRLVALLTFSCAVIPGVQAEVFSIVVVPDTQWYPETNPAIMEGQMRWIVENRELENIIYVAHLGDLKNNQGCATTNSPDGRTEWQVVDQAMALLEDPATTGLADGIPYGVLPGNHDFDQEFNAVMGQLWCPNYDDQRPLTNYNGSLGDAQFRGKGYYGDSFVRGSNENNYTLFDFCGIEFIAVNLAYRENAVAIPPPSTSELAWANRLLSVDYPNRIAIVSSHFILSEGGNFGSYGSSVYDALSANSNLFMMLGAHRFGEAWRTESREGMDPVNIFLANYQSIRYPTGPTDFTNLVDNAPGDSGFMRIMRFDTDQNKVFIRTFAPRIESLGRMADLVSSNDVSSPAQLNRNTASNITIDFDVDCSIERPRPPGGLEVN